MASYVGSSLILNWITAAATTSLSGDARTFTQNETIDTVDATAGADTQKQWLPGPKDRTANLTYLHQQGTADIVLTYPGQIGTLDVYPQGSSTGSPKYSYPFLVNSYAKSIPYAGVVEHTIGFLSYGSAVLGTAA